MAGEIPATGPPGSWDASLTKEDHPAHPPHPPEGPEAETRKDVAAPPISSYLWGLLRGRWGESSETALVPPGPHFLPSASPQLTPKTSVEPCETEKPKTSFFAVPMEMRGSFLVLLLRECFRDLGWLATIPSISGEVGLLVTSTVPQTPFFWAMHITETLHRNMLALFSALAEAEEQQPYLHDSAVRRGTRGLAEYHLGSYGPAWNRCWVLDRVDSWVVVMFVDFGQSATIPVQSLRTLDSDDFWTIPPLTQPFMLEKGILSSNQVIHRILKGKITGALNLESHILKFEEFK
ncbi:tudor domain-containing protein 10 isoform X3 [Muntiacus reevesi]|uniref:tudor domain-containing protein 10 isoform X3 n=1 Tax=Muntiacus reevesi TaxID=9886 RepID=UPI0033074E03